MIYIMFTLKWQSPLVAMIIMAGAKEEVRSSLQMEEVTVGQQNIWL